MYTIQEINNQNPLLNQVVISQTSTNFRAIIFPNLGASLQYLESNNIQIIDGIPPTEEGLKTYQSKFNSSFLFPFPSRIENGSYSFNNKKYQLECNEKALQNALHGHIHNKPFNLEIDTAEDITQLCFTYEHNGSTQGFPFPYQLSITYSFSSNHIEIGFNISNIGSETFPFGIGWHPYFKTENLASCILDFKADKQYFLNDQMIPEKEIPTKHSTPLTINDTFLDDCFIAKESSLLFKSDCYEIDMAFSSPPPNSFIQSYTPPGRKSIAIEPMTCAGNCLNNKIGLLELDPNEQYQWDIELNFKI